jgi:tRNA pseudouridine38-40 synthase
LHDCVTMRYFFHIGFNGYHYRGWQRQAGATTVQEIVEATLGQALKTTVSIMGCGRTDAQVHASQFFFHADIEKEWDYDLVFRLNKLLPDDIAIYEIIPVEDTRHARFDATRRTYNYFIHTRKDPFLAMVSSLYLEKNLDTAKMKEAAAILLRYDDYGALCKTPADYRTTICKVTSATLFVNGAGDKFRFQISANRFLGRMFRIIMGKFLEIGRGALAVSEFEHYLISKQTPPILEPAYPQGLWLSKVTYPYLDIASKSEFMTSVHAEEAWDPI